MYNTTENIALFLMSQDVKCCFADDTLPDGLSVNKGDLINYQPFAMGRMKFLWGEDAEVFRPERWLNDDGVFEPENPFKFPAFQVSLLQKSRISMKWYKFIAEGTEFATLLVF